MVKTGSELGIEICKALGIDPKNVRSLKLVCEPDTLATLHLEMNVSNSLADTVKRYDLVSYEVRARG